MRTFKIYSLNKWVKTWVKGVKRYKLPVIKYLSPGVVMYSMVTRVKNNCIVYLKIAKRIDLKILEIKMIAKIITCEVVDFKVHKK